MLLRYAGAAAGLPDAVSELCRADYAATLLSFFYACFFFIFLTRLLFLRIADAAADDAVSHIAVEAPLFLLLHHTPFFRRHIGALLLMLYDAAVTRQMSRRRATYCRAVSCRRRCYDAPC